MKKRITSIILALVLLLALLPAGALADGTGTAAQTLAGNIAAGWQNSMDKENWPWVEADMVSANDAGAYGPGASHDLTAAQKQAFIDYAVGAMSQSGVSDGDLAKNIIGLSAIGADARSLTTYSGASLDAAAKLAADAGTQSGIYTLPWMLIALRKFGTDYNSQCDAVVNSILGQKLSAGGWGYTYNGTETFDADATSAVLIALGPYYSVNSDVKTAIDGTLAAINKNVALNAAGAVSSWGAASAESTALLIAGLASAGENPETFFSGKNIISGLLSMADAGGAGFDRADYDSSYQLTGTYSLNAMSTEQGFRGLIAAAGYAKNGGAYALYDFSAVTKVPAVAASPTYCPVSISAVPSDAAVTVEQGKNAIAPVSGIYDLAAGTYSYTVSKAGYGGKTGSIEVTADDAAKHTAKAVSVSLASQGGTQSGTASSITVTAAVKTHPEGKADGTYTFKYDSASYTTAAEKTLTLSAGSSAFDALDALNVSYHEKSWDYIDSIAGIAELAHGPNSGWLFMVNGRPASVGCREYKLSSGDSVVWFYTDDYTRDYGSEAWGGASAGTVNPSKDDNKETALPFTDLKSQADKEAVAAVYGKRLMCGVSGTAFVPEAPLSRAMAATILWSLAGKPSAADKTAAFTDVNGGWYAQAVNWAVATGVAAGCGNGLFRPGDAVTREQLAAMLYKFAGSPEAKTELSAYSDAGEVSGWALPAVKWAVGEGYAAGASKTLLDPKGIVDRAQCAAIIAAYCGKNA